MVMWLARVVNQNKFFYSGHVVDNL